MQKLFYKNLSIWKTIKCCMILTISWYFDRIKWFIEIRLNSFQIKFTKFLISKRSTTLGIIALFSLMMETPLGNLCHIHLQDISRQTVIIVFCIIVLFSAIFQLTTRKMIQNKNSLVKHFKYKYHFHANHIVKVQHDMRFIF